MRNDKEFSDIKVFYIIVKLMPLEITEDGAAENVSISVKKQSEEIIQWDKSNKTVCGNIYERSRKT